MKLAYGKEVNEQMLQNKNTVKKRRKISAFDIINILLVVLITVVTIYPLYFCIIASFSSPNEVALGHTLLWIKDFTLDSYKYVMQESRLWVSYRNTIIYTIFGTLYNLVLTIPAAYVLSKKYLPFRNVLSWYFFITMYIGGGIIPQYFLVKNLGLIDHPLALIVGSGVSCANLIMTRQYFQSSIPESLYESARIDGATEWCAFRKIAMPLAKPIIAVMTLYYGVTRWNSYYNALLYIRSDEYKPLQLVLREILMNNQLSILDLSGTDADTMQLLVQRATAAEGMKYAIVFIASLPLLIVYPFVQKYFVKGVMVGSVKG